MTEAARIQEDPPLPPRLAGSRLIADGMLEDVLSTQPVNSPAQALQQQLLRAYLAQPAAAADQMVDRRHPLPVRVAIIFGLAALCWVPLVGAGVALARLLG